MTVPLRLATAGFPTATPAAIAAPTSRVNPFVRGALLLFVMSIPFEMPDRTFPIEIPRLFALIFLVTTLFNLRACYRTIPAALIWFALHLWILGIAAVLSGVVHIESVLKHFVTLAMLMMLMWTVSNALQDARVVRSIFMGFIIACTVRAGLQVLQIGVHKIQVWTGGERITVLGQNTNMSAMILSAGFITVVGLSAAPATWLPKIRPFTWPLAALMAWATIQTGSRGGLLCISAGLLVMLFSGRTVKARIRNAVFVLIAMAALGFAASNSALMRGRLQLAAQQGNLAGREKIYPALIAMFKERPFTGWGPIENQYEIGSRINERRLRSRDAHNLLGELLTTSGMLGALPFLVGLGLCIRGAFRARHGALGFLPLALLASVLTGCISGTWLVSNILWLALAVGIAAGARWAHPMTTKVWSTKPCVE